MAYLRDLPKPKCRTCGANAHVEVVNSRNAPIGFYCRRDGLRALKQAQLDEQPR